jgi:uncharacterized protein involved in exopolysaccharide biosynthesis
MNPREDDDLSFDDSDDNDPVIRELRAELVRLEAQLDQLLAAEREREAEIAELRARMEDLERAIEAIRTRFRTQFRLWVTVAALYGASIGIGISWLMR